MNARWIGSALLLPLLLSCDRSTEVGGPLAPDHSQVREREPRIVKFARGLAPSPVDTAFWAVRGRERSLILRYPDSEAFLVFTVPEEGLLAKPNGAPFQPGDSVEIEVAFSPEEGFHFDFQPSGLTFSRSSPAELTVYYRRADPDLNGDGEVDQRDAAVEHALRIFQQESPRERWFPLPSRVSVNDDEARAAVFGFTGFALASN